MESNVEMQSVKADVYESLSLAEISTLNKVLNFIILLKVLKASYLPQKVVLLFSSALKELNWFKTK